MSRNFRTKISLRDHLNRLPPFIVIALARSGRGRGVRALTYEEIASRSGMTVRTIHRYANRISWDDVPVKAMQDLANACGVDIFSQSEALDYLNKTRRTSRPFAHLSRRRFNSVCEAGQRWNEEVIKPAAASSSPSET